MAASETWQAQTYRRICKCLEANGFVMVRTYSRAWECKKKHLPLFSLGKDGRLYLQHGRRRDCIDYCEITLYQ